MVKGATRRLSPESCASGQSQSKSNDMKKVPTRARKGKEPTGEDSSVADSATGEDSRNGIEHEAGTKRTRSPATASKRRAPREETPDESDNEDNSEDDHDDSEEEHNDEDEEVMEDGGEEKPEATKRPRGNKRKVNTEESNETNSPMPENGKRRRQLRTKPEPQSPSRASSRSPAAIGTSPRRGRPRRSNPIVNLDEATRKRMSELMDAITTFAKNGKQLIEVFYGLPQKASYPDYYDVISEPIDMYIIEERVEANKYRSERALLYDLALMLKNAKTYNDEESDVYRDASQLELLLKATWQKILAQKDEKVDPLYIMFETIFDFEDETGRQLIVPFMKLPSKAEFPSYYEIIRRPIDVARIREKLFSEAYALLDDLVSDFRLLFDNSCKFNDPDSQLYRDAFVLLRICNVKRQELLGIAPDPAVMMGMTPQSMTGQGAVEPPPDALRALQDMMRELLSCLHQCRCPPPEGSENAPVEFYVKRLGDLMPTTDDSTSSSSSGLSQLPPLSALERVRQNVELIRYRRLDRFQDDVFEILHNVRMISAPSSAAFQASVHLQEEFIKRRDAITENGRRLFTTASQYGLQELHADVERDIGAGTTPVPPEGGSDHSDGEPEEDSQTASQSGLTSITLSGQTFAIGDYVYVKTFSPVANGTANPETRLRIVMIRKLWEDETTHQSMISGSVFLRPDETYHMINRKFFANEVFISDSKYTGPATAVAGRCLVLLPRIFFRFKAEGLPENDVFVCDTRYSSRSRHMSKLRGWKGVFVPRETSVQEESQNDEQKEQKSATPVPEDGFSVGGSSGIRIVRRPAPIHPPRNVPSVFSVKQHEQAAVSDAASNANPAHPAVAILDKFREDIPLIDAVPPGDSSIQPFEQLVGPPPSRVAVKLGDFVYVAVQPYLTVVLRVERLFTQSGAEGTVPYICGTRLLLPNEVSPGPHDQTSRELVLSTQMETHPMSRVIGRCLVLALREYCLLRCPEIMERDTFLCESECVGSDMPGLPPRLRKVQNVAIPNFKKYSPNIVEDEVFFFSKPITVRRPIPLGGAAAAMVGHHLPLSSSSSSTCDSGLRMVHHHLAEESSSLGGADELARMAALSGHDDFKITNSPSSSLTHSDAHMSSSRKLLPGSSHRGRGVKSSNRGNGPISGWTVFSRYMHHDKEMGKLMLGKEFPERAKMIAEKWRLLPADQRAKYIDEARIEEEGRRAKRAAAAAVAAANEANAGSMSSIDAARSPAPMMMQQGPPGGMMPQGPNQGPPQMVMTPNGPMMMSQAPPQQQPFYPDQMHMPPGMQQPYPGGGGPPYFQRPPQQMPPQYPPQQMNNMGRGPPYFQQTMQQPMPPGFQQPYQQQQQFQPHMAPQMQQGLMNDGGMPPGFQQPYMNGHHPPQPQHVQMMHDGGMPPGGFQQHQQQQFQPQFHPQGPAPGPGPYMQGPPQHQQPHYPQPPPPHQQQYGGPQQGYPGPQQGFAGPHGPPPMAFSPHQQPMPPMMPTPPPQQMPPHQMAPPPQHQQQQMVPPPQQQQPQFQQPPSQQQAPQVHAHPQPQQQAPVQRGPEPGHVQQAPPPPQEPPRPLAPIVHAVPPRPNRLVHSETFLRYLDGLGAASQAANSRPFISDWPRTMSITENQIYDALQNNETRARLSSMVGPSVVAAAANGHGPGSEESRAALVGALYKLNSSLIGDTLNLSHVLDYEQL